MKIYLIRRFIYYYFTPSCDWSYYEKYSNEQSNKIV